MRIRPVGAYALLLDCDDPDQVEAWRAELWHRRAAGELAAVEIVPAARTVLLDGVPDPGRAAALVAGWTPRPTDAATPAGGAAAEVEVPVAYDGADLPVVAGHWGVDVPEVVARLTGTRFRVAFCGFAPGFAYLTGLPQEWAVP
ncbi:carboxyltransferase domain-containing protein, partial [Micromonospora sp. KC207]|uniref:carboxyltransferase domain-containing protein n=1 Tax=Micromonospora sp. KC207 TaxID=2530377 RepID=UPI00104A4237